MKTYGTLTEAQRIRKALRRIADLEAQLAEAQRREEQLLAPFIKMGDIINYLTDIQKLLPDRIRDSLDILAEMMEAAIDGGALESGE